MTSQKVTITITLDDVEVVLLRKHIELEVGRERRTVAAVLASAHARVDLLLFFLVFFLGLVFH